MPTVSHCDFLNLIRIDKNGCISLHRDISIVTSVELSLVHSIYRSRFIHKAENAALQSEEFLLQAVTESSHFGNGQSIPQALPKCGQNRLQGTPKSEQKAQKHAKTSSKWLCVSSSSALRKSYKNTVFYHGFGASKLSKTTRR